MSLLRAQTKEFGLIDTDGRLFDQRLAEERTIQECEEMQPGVQGGVNNEPLA